jgi:fucose permease
VSRSDGDEDLADPIASYGDWIVTYMGRVRHVDRAIAASASSVFWIGMVVGRVILSGVTERLGIQKTVAAYVVLSIIAQIALQLLANVSAVLVMLAVVGFFFGPFFPSGIVLLGKKLPMQCHVGAVSVAAAMGQVGGSTCPLIVGFMADAFGMAKLLDVATALSVLLLVVWVLFCRC